MTQGAAYGGKDQALINIRPRLPRIKLDHRSRRFLVAPSIRLGSPAQQRSKPVPTTVFFASNRILTGDPAVVASYGPNIQPPSVSTDIIYATAFVDGVNIKADQAGAITSIQDSNKGGLCPERGKRPVQRGPQSFRLYTWVRQHLRRRDHARCF